MIPAVALFPMQLELVNKVDLRVTLILFPFFHMVLSVAAASAARLLLMNFQISLPLPFGRCFYVHVNPSLNAEMMVALGAYLPGHCWMSFTWRWLVYEMDRFKSCSEIVSS